MYSLNILCLLLIKFLSNLILIMLLLITFNSYSFAYLPTSFLVISFIRCLIAAFMSFIITYLQFGKNQSSKDLNLNLDWKPVLSPCSDLSNTPIAINMGLLKYLL